jgi:hypothetical protein
MKCHGSACFLTAVFDSAPPYRISSPNTRPCTLESSAATNGELMIFLSVRCRTMRSGGLCAVDVRPATCQLAMSCTESDRAAPVASGDSRRLESTCAA